MAVQLEINYSGKGLKAKVDEMVNDTALTGKWNYSFGYIEVPLMFKYLFGGNRVGPFVEAGAYYGYFLTGKFSEYGEFDGKEILNNEFELETDYEDENDNQKANRNEYGFKLGLGYNFEIDDSMIFVALRYSQGLTDIVTYRTKPDDYSKTYNRTFQIAVGYLFELGSEEEKEYWY
jgi:opacity protein-like surface antigen